MLSLYLSLFLSLSHQVPKYRLQPTVSDLKWIFKIAIILNWSTQSLRVLQYFPSVLNIWVCYLGISVFYLCLTVKDWFRKSRRFSQLIIRSRFWSILKEGCSFLADYSIAFHGDMVIKRRNCESKAFRSRNMATTVNGLHFGKL